MNPIQVRQRRLVGRDGPSPVPGKRRERRGLPWILGFVALVLPGLPLAAQEDRSPADVLLVMDASGSMQVPALSLGEDSSLGEELMLGVLDLASLAPGSRLGIAGIGGWNEGPEAAWIWRGPDEGMPAEGGARARQLAEARRAVEAFRGTSQASDPNVFTERVLAPFAARAAKEGREVRVILLTDGETEIDRLNLREGVYEGTWAAAWSESAEKKAIEALGALEGQKVHVTVFRVDPSGGATPPSDFLRAAARLNDEDGAPRRLEADAGITDLFLDLWLDEPMLGRAASACEPVVDHGWVHVAGDTVEGAFPVVGPGKGARLLLWGPGCGGALTLRRGTDPDGEVIPDATWQGGRGPHHRVLRLDGLARGTYTFSLQPEGAPLGSRIEWLCLQRLSVEPFFALESPHEGPWRPGDEANLAAGWRAIGAETDAAADPSLVPDLDVTGSVELLAKEPRPGYRRFRIDPEAAAGAFAVRASFRIPDPIPGTERLRCCYPVEHEVALAVKPLARLAPGAAVASGEQPVERHPFPLAARLVSGTLPPRTATRVEVTVVHPSGVKNSFDLESSSPKELQGTWKPKGSGEFRIPAQSFPAFDLEEARFPVSPIPWWLRWLWPLVAAAAAILALVLWLLSVRRFGDQHLRLLDEEGGETSTVHFLRQLPGKGMSGGVSGPPEVEGAGMFQIRHRPFPATTRLRAADAGLKVTVDDRAPAGSWAALPSGCVVALEKDGTSTRYRFYEVPASVDEDRVILDLDA